MKTFQIRVSKEGKHRCLKFKSELPVESVLAAVEAVVKNTYHVSIREIHWKVPEDRDIMWAIKEASSIRFYRKVWRNTLSKVLIPEPVGTIALPKGTKVDYNFSTNTFFDICIPNSLLSLNVSEVNKVTGLDICTTNEGVHPFYLRGHYSIKCKERSTFVEVNFYKIRSKLVVNSELVTEEL